MSTAPDTAAAKVETATVKVDTKPTKTDGSHITVTTTPLPDNETTEIASPTETEWKITIKGSDGATSEVVLSPVSAKNPARQEVNIYMPDAKAAEDADLEQAKTEEVRHHGEENHSLTHSRKCLPSRPARAAIDEIPLVHNDTTGPHGDPVPDNHRRRGPHAGALPQHAERRGRLAHQPAAEPDLRAARHGRAELHRRHHHLRRQLLLRPGQEPRHERRREDPLRHGLPAGRRDRHRRWLLQGRSVVVRRRGPVGLDLLACC